VTAKKKPAPALPLTRAEIDWYRPRHYLDDDGRTCHWCREVFPCPTQRWLATVDAAQAAQSAGHAGPELLARAYYTAANDYGQHPPVHTEAFWTAVAAVLDRIHE
jgi:hypothetical protein